jgi:hypothetical protein
MSHFSFLCQGIHEYKRQQWAVLFKHTNYKSTQWSSFLATFLSSFTQFYRMTFIRRYLTTSFCATYQRLFDVEFNDVNVARDRSI